jgi:LacI family transcriptional regulator
MTVSNVLRGAKAVQPATKEAVLNAVAKLGYKPNPAASALASAMQLRIGLVYRNPDSPYLTALLLGALEASTARGGQLLPQRMYGNSRAAVVDSVVSLHRSGAGGALVPAPWSELLDDNGHPDELPIPVVGVSPGRDLENFAAVRIDDEGAAKAMTELLISKGHRRVALIGGPAGHSASLSRQRGYVAALREAGLKVDPSLIQPGEFTFESAVPATETLLALRDPPTAIFATNDEMGAGTISTCLRHGVQVPDKIAVAGFDDTPIATRIWPPLTTVRQPGEAIAECATAELIAIMNGGRPNAAGTTHVPFEIIERESTK